MLLYVLKLFRLSCKQRSQEYIDSEQTTNPVQIKLSLHQLTFMTIMTEWETIEDNEEIKAEFQGYKDGMARLKEGGWAFLPSTAAMIDTYKVHFNFSLSINDYVVILIRRLKAKLFFNIIFQAMSVKPSDVWVVTQPKCGTTWTQEMVPEISSKNNKYFISPGLANSKQR